tara:strand:- start:206 stop:856 length:651 start_codon:yes stop_codon:yes gene_type:complete
VSKSLLSILTLLTLSLLTLGSANASGAPDLGQWTQTYCEGYRAAKNLYDCQCVVDQAPAYVEKEVAKQVAMKERAIGNFQEVMKKQQSDDRLTAEQKAQAKAGYQKRIDQEQAAIDKLKNRSSWDKKTMDSIASAAMIEVYTAPTCKTGAVFLDPETQICKFKGEKLQKQLKNKTVDEYCDCLRETMAKTWEASTGQTSAKIQRDLFSEANRSCNQ